MKKGILLFGICATALLSSCASTTTVTVAQPEDRLKQ